MSTRFTVRLTAEQDAQLEVAAMEDGLTPDEWILRAVEVALALANPDQMPVTPAEREVLRSRQQAYLDDPSRVLSSEEFFDQIERDRE